MRQASRQVVEVLAGLRLDAGERVALGLQLDYTDGLGVSVEHLVGIARDERELPNGHAEARRDIHLAVVLRDPTSLF